MRGSKQFPHDGDGGGECVDKFKIYKKGVPEILDIPLHSCICNVRDIFISYMSLAARTVIIHVTAQNEINEHGYILRQYICVDINTKMRRKKPTKM